MPVPAAVVAQMQPIAAVAFIYMPAQFGSPALADGVQCPALPWVGAPPIQLLLMVAQYIGHFVLGPHLTGCTEYPSG